VTLKGIQFYLDFQLISGVMNFGRAIQYICLLILSKDLLDLLVIDWLKWFTAATAHAGEVKERMDKFDDATKTLGYTVLEGDPRYSSFSAEMKFVPVGETSS